MLLKDVEAEKYSINTQNFNNSLKSKKGRYIYIFFLIFFAHLSLQIVDHQRHNQIYDQWYKP